MDKVQPAIDAIIMAVDEICEPLTADEYAEVMSIISDDFQTRLVIALEESEK